MLNDGRNRPGCGRVLTDKTIGSPTATFAGVFLMKCALLLSCASLAA